MGASRRQLELMVELKRRGGEFQNETPTAGADFAFSVGGGFNRGLANVLGAPVDLANAALSLVGADSERPVGGSASIQAGLANLGTTVQPGEELPNKFVGRIAEEVGAAAVPFGAIGSAVRLGAQGGRFTKPILDFFRNAPGTLATTELGAAATAGTAAAVAQQALPGNQTAETVAQIAGGLISPTTLLSEQAPKAAAGVRNALRPLSKPGAQDVAAGVAQKAVRGEPLQVARQLEQPTDFVEGAKITPAGETGDPGLLSLERAIASKSSEVSDNISESLTQTNKAVTEELAALRGQGKIDDTTVALANRTNRVVNALKARQEQAVQEAAQKTRNLGPNATREQANTIVRTEIDNALVDARVQERELWGDVDTEVPASVQPARQALADIKATRDPDIDDPADIPDFVSRLLNKPKVKDGKITNGALANTESIGRVQKLRSRILGEIRAERAKDAPNRNKVRILEDISANLLEGLGAQADDTAVRTAMAYSRELNQRFTQGSVGKLLGFEKTGEAAIDPALTLEKTVGKAGPAAAVGLEDIRRAADTGETAGAVEDFLKDRFIRSVAPDGKIKPAGARKFLTENKQVLDRNPQLRAQFQKAISSQQAADDLVKSTTQTVKSIQDARRTASSIILNANVDSEIAKVLASKNPALAMKQIVRKVSGDKEAFAGLKAGFIDELLKKSTTQAIDLDSANIVSGRKMTEFIKKNKNLIENSGLFTKEEAVRLNRVAKTAKAIESEISSGKSMKDVIDTTPDAITELVASVIGAEAGRRVSGALGGGTIQTPGRFAQLARKLTSKVPVGNVTDILSEAVLDKKLMAALLRKPKTDKEVASVRTAIRGFLANTIVPDEFQGITIPINTEEQ